MGFLFSFVRCLNLFPEISSCKKRNDLFSCTIRLHGQFNVGICCATLRSRTSPSNSNARRQTFSRICRTERTTEKCELFWLHFGRHPIVRTEMYRQFSPLNKLGFLRAICRFGDFCVMSHTIGYAHLSTGHLKKCHYISFLPVTKLAGQNHAPRSAASLGSPLPFCAWPTAFLRP
jgi:hypothetical protein